MYEQIYKSSYSVLPSILAANEEPGLDSGELEGLLERMRYIDQLRFELNEWKFIDLDSEKIDLFIDRIELHSALCLALPSRRAEYSWWLAHKALEPFPISQAVSPVVLEFLGLAVPSLRSEKNKFDIWVSSAAVAIQKGLQDFFCEDATMQEVWGNLVAVNSTVALVLSGISRQRII